MCGASSVRPHPAAAAASGFLTSGCERAATNPHDPRQRPMRISDSTATTYTDPDAASLHTTSVRLFDSCSVVTTLLFISYK